VADKIVGLSSAVSIDPVVAAPSAPQVAVPSPADLRTRWWAELLTIAWLCWVYDAVNNLAPLRLGRALSHGRGILSLERSLGIDPELSLDRWLAHHGTLAAVLSDYYDNVHFIATLALLGYLWWKRGDIYRPLRNILVLINVLGFIVFWLYPVAPPRLLDGFTDVVASSHAFGSWHTGPLASEANQLAAMPSLHIAWALWCTMAVWQMTRRPWLRVLAILYPCLTAFAVISTGNHYVLDMVGGAVTMVVAVLIVRAIGRIRGQTSVAPAM
jgi:hypothetical protein